jgi:hypothetical protein
MAIIMTRPTSTNGLSCDKIYRIYCQNPLNRHDEISLEFRVFPVWEFPIHEKNN